MVYENGPQKDTLYFNGTTIILETGFAQENGLRHGKWHAYYENGNLRAEGYFQDGKKEGLWKMYTIDAEIAVTGHYHKDLPHHQWQWFYKTGNVKFQRTYFDGKKEGIWQGYFPDGKLYGEAHFSSGQLLSGVMFSKDGEQIEFVTLGKIMERIVAHENTDGTVAGEIVDSKELLWNFAINSGNAKMIKELADGGSEIKQNYIDSICKKWYEASANGGGEYGLKKLDFYNSEIAKQLYRSDYGSNFEKQLLKDKELAIKNHQKNEAIIKKCREMITAFDAYQITIRKNFIIKILSIDYLEDAQFTDDEISFLWERSKIKIDEIVVYHYPFENPEEKTLMDIALDSTYIKSKTVAFLIEKGFKVTYEHLQKLASVREKYFQDQIPDEDGLVAINHDKNDLYEADQTLTALLKNLKDCKMNAITESEDNIKIRIFPSSSSRVAALFSSGTLIKVISEEDSTWTSVEFEDGKKGYVFSKNVVRL